MVSGRCIRQERVMEQLVAVERVNGHYVAESLSFPELRAEAGMICKPPGRLARRRPFKTLTVPKPGVALAATATFTNMRFGPVTKMRRTWMALDPKATLV